MKRKARILVLAIFSIFIASTSFSASLNVTGPGINGAPLQVASVCGTTSNSFQYIISNSLGGNLPATIPLVITFSLMQDPGSPPLIPFIPATTCAGSTNCNNPAANFPLSFTQVSGCGPSFTTSSSGNTLTVTLTLSPGSVPVCTLDFSIYVDCSVSANDLYLESSWSSTTHLLNGSPSFDLDAAISLEVPEFSFVGSNPNFSTSYFQPLTTDFTFTYNGGVGCSDINLSFTDNSLTACNLGAITYSYSVNGGSFQPFTNGTPFLLSQLCNNSTIVIRQHIAQVTGCIADCNLSGLNANLNWTCASGPVGSCNTCPIQPGCNINYTLSDNANLNGDLRISRILPVPSTIPSDDSAQYDKTCAGQKLNWEYRIDNLSLTEVFPELQMRLTYNWILANPTEFGKSQLSKISAADVEVLLNGITPVAPLAVFPEGPGINDESCEAQITDAINDILFSIPNLLPGEFVTLRFETYRCCDEDPDLYNMIKYFNEWFLRVSVLTECDVQITPTMNETNTLFAGWHNYYGTGQFGGPGRFISATGNFNHSNNLNLNLSFTPTVADMSVPQNQIFGSSEPFFIETLGMLQNVLARQVVGATPVDPEMQGILRVHVFSNTGLVLDNIANVHISPPFPGTPWTPIACHSTESTPRNCEPTDYFFYFDLADPNAFNYLQNGMFRYDLAPCCGPGGSIEVEFEYDLLYSDTCTDFSYPPGLCGNTPTCSNCCWLPLSNVSQNINVHCPGCLAPGIIVDSYRMRRLNTGLQDTDNNSLTDVGSPLIDNAYLNNFPVRIHQSGHNDILQDVLTAFFVDGDNTMGGYSYPQNMIPNNAILDHLQLARDIPFGATMNLNVESIELYIDAVDINNGTNCFECNGFYTPGQLNDFNTILKACFPPSYAGLQFADNGEDRRFLFTFNVADILSNACATFSAFNGFETDPLQLLQYYRLKVNYSVCGNFPPDGLTSTDIDAVRRTSEILNTMWLSGMAHPITVNQTDLQMPNTMPIDPITPVFADTNLFYCEAFSGFHYFVSLFTNESICTTCYGADADTLCGRTIRMDFATGFGNNHFGNLFPYEFRPSPLYFDEFTFDVPEDWTMHRVDYQNTYVRINPANLAVTPVVNVMGAPVIGPGILTVQELDLPVHACAPFDAFNGNPNEYFSDEKSFGLFRFRLIPTNVCDTALLDTLDPNTLDFNYHLQNQCVVPSNLTTCNTTCNSIASNGNCTPLVFRDSLPLYYSDTLIIGSTNPNMQMNLIITQAIVSQPGVCIPFNISNPSITGSTQASYPFMAIPIASIPFVNLSSMSITLACSNTVINGLQNTLGTHIIFALPTPMPANYTCTGTICFQVNDCPFSNESIPVMYGWDCDNITVNTNPLAVCNVTGTEILVLNSLGLNVDLQPFSVPSTWNACDTTQISYQLESSQGNIVPSSVILGNPPSGLQVSSVWLTDCLNGSAYGPLTEISAGVYEIPAVNPVMQSLGDSIGGGEIMCIVIDFIADCSFNGDFPGPEIEYTTFCGSVDTITSVGASLGSYAQNLCTDCFNCNDVVLNVGPNSGCTINASLSINGTAACSSMVVNWYFGDGNVLLNAPLNVNHIYSISGTYTLSYEVYCWSDSDTSATLCLGDTILNVECDSAVSNNCMLIEDVLTATSRPNMGNDIIQSSDIGLVVVGDMHESFIDRDQYLFKLKNNFNLDFNSIFGDVQNLANNENAYSVLETNDAFYVVGASAFGNGNEDVVVTKFSNTFPFNLQWCHNYDFGQIDVGRKIILAADMNLLVGGYTTSNLKGNPNDYDAFLLKISPDGDVVGSGVKFYGDWYDDEFLYDLILLENKINYVAIGDHQNSNSTDMLVFNTDLNLNLINDVVIDGGKNESGRALVEMDNKLYIVGSSESFTSSSEIFVVKMSTIISCNYFSKVFGTGLLNEYGNDIIKTTEKNLLIVGRREKEEQVDGIQLKIKDDLSFVRYMVSTEDRSNDWFNAVTEHNQDSYVMIGTYQINTPEHEIYMVKTDTLGKSCCMKKEALKYKVVLPLCEKILKEEKQECKVDTMGLFDRIYEPKIICEDQYSLRLETPVVSSSGIIQLFPNPNSGQFILQVSERGLSIESVRVFDLQGRQLFYIEESINEQTRKLNLNTVQKGLYLVEVMLNNGSVETIKLLIQE
jgi:hypothetical protein